MTAILKTVVSAFGKSACRGIPTRWLAVGWQDDDLVVWFEGLPEGTDVRRLIAVPTGASVPAESYYVGSAQRSEPDGSFLVMHVYTVPS